MFDAISPVLPVFLVILSGYVVCRIGLISAETGSVMNNFVFYIALPAFLLKAMAEVPTSHLFNWSYVLSFFLSSVFVFVFVSVVMKYVFKKSISDTVLAMMSGGYVNSAHLGIPIIMAVFGNISPIVVAIVMQVLIFMPIIIFVLDFQIGNYSRGRGAFLVEILYRNPIILASALGFMLATQEIKLPGFIDDFCGLLGSAGVPTALFTLGFTLGGIKLQNSTSLVKEIGLLVFAKLLIHPLVACLIGVYIFGLSDKWLASLMVVTAMPTAVNSFVLSRRYKVAVDRSSIVVFATTAISTVTLPIITFLFGSR
ncbi:MAG: AEC family transporter [Deltaproteobacteria bacterium]|nr:AEC family transporter [Deltaproteobacteria bacterium]